MNIKIHTFFLIQEMKRIILLLASTLRVCKSTTFLMIAKIVVYFDSSNAHISSGIVTVVYKYKCMRTVHAFLCN